VSNFFLPLNAVTVAIVVGLVALAVILILFWNMINGPLVKVIKTIFNILLWLMVVVLLAAAVYVMTGWAVFAHMRYYSNKVNEHMPIAEVREALDGVFTESGATLEEIAAAGHLPDSLPDAQDNRLYARKYSYFLWDKLYFYVIYDEKDTVRLSIDPCE